MVSYLYCFINRIEVIKKVKFVPVMKFVKVRKLFHKREVRFARAKQL